MDIFLVNHLVLWRRSEVLLRNSQKGMKGGGAAATRFEYEKVPDLMVEVD